ncbi:MAG TPA: TolC family outer membrane protein [Candidatus Angelobacter sp.]|nr:TolC family outer membrane protein [Candidatus Angelobacter sp.]
MKRKFRGILLATAAAGLTLIVDAVVAPTWAMSLQEAVSMAISTNPSVGEVSNDRRAIDQELRQGRALYYPQVDLRAASGVEWSNNDTTHSDGNTSCCRTLWRKEGSVTLSQLIFDGFFAESEVERQTSRVKSAAYRVQESAEFTGLDAVEAYLDIQRHRERVQLAENNVSVHRARLGQVQQKAQAGGGNIADVRQAEARLANAESSLVETQGNLKDAESQFIKVVGQAADTLDEVTMPADALPTDVDTAVNASVANSPTVAFARQDIKTAEADVKQQEASLYPDIRLEVSGSADDNVDGRTTADYGASALVVLRYNLYRGGADTARIREFKWRLAEAIDAEHTKERKVSDDARVSWNAIDVSHSNVEILGRQVQADIKTRDVYKQQFEIGQRGLLDLLDADNELYLANDNLITARYAEVFANFRLLATMGALQKTLGITPLDSATQLKGEN